MAKNTLIVAKAVTRESVLRNGLGTIRVPITLIHVRSNPTVPTAKHAHTITVTVLFRQCRTRIQLLATGRGKADEARIIIRPPGLVKGEGFRD